MLDKSQVNLPDKGQTNPFRTNAKQISSQMKAKAHQTPGFQRVRVRVQTAPPPILLSLFFLVNSTE